MKSCIARAESAGANTYTAIAKDVTGRTSSDSVTVNLPAAPSFTYDANGNLTSVRRNTTLTVAGTT